MIQFTPDQLHQASILAAKIERLEALREKAEDHSVDVNLGSPSGDSPMGYHVAVVVPATEIRAKLVEQLGPLYAALRALGIHLRIR